MRLPVRSSPGFFMAIYSFDGWLSRWFTLVSACWVNFLVASIARVGACFPLEMTRVKKCTVKQKLCSQENKLRRPADQSVYIKVPVMLSLAVCLGWLPGISNERSNFQWLLAYCTLFAFTKPSHALINSVQSRVRSN